MLGHVSPGKHTLFVASSERRHRRGRFDWCCHREAPLGRVVQLSKALTERVDANAQRQRFVREGVEACLAVPELLQQVLA